uniref:Uncharacterized protein n=1 Tax=viral metagenome TaxID=1070528 RepID=A0A6M3J9A0_9ZZZZ
MSYDRKQFSDCIVRSLKARHGLYSGSALALLLGTAAVESDFGVYLRQRGGGPALSAFQIERPTFNWLQSVYGDRYGFADREFEEIETDLDLAILVARLRYRVDPNPLPEPEDVIGLAAYWKRVYNTTEGAGSVEEFLAKFARYVGLPS